MTAARMTEPAVGASVCASGSHVCTGNIGTLMTKASAKAAQSQICTWRGSISRWSSKKSKLGTPPFDLRVGVRDVEDGAEHQDQPKNV